MNQILVTEKIYVTPELKRKKKFFKLEFFLSVFLVCILSSYYIYAEYNRNETEQVSQQILAEIKTDMTTKKIDKNDVMIIYVDQEEESNQNEEANSEQPVEEPKEQKISSTYTTSSGKKYSMEAIITIPKIKIQYPVLTDTSDALLQVSVNKYHGPHGPNEIGNYCIVGHNYRNGKMFGSLSKLVNGDTVELQDLTGRTLTYEVYDRFVVKPTDVSCTSQKAQLASRKKELTLITCTNYGKERLVVKCREI